MRLTWWNNWRMIGNKAIPTTSICRRYRLDLEPKGIPFFLFSIPFFQSEILITNQMWFYLTRLPKSICLQESKWLVLNSSCLKLNYEWLAYPGIIISPPPLPPYSVGNMNTDQVNICCPRDCVSRHNGGTSGAPIMPRDAVSRTAHVGT